MANFFEDYLSSILWDILRLHLEQKKSSDNVSSLKNNSIILLSSEDVSYFSNDRFKSSKLSKAIDAFLHFLQITFDISWPQKKSSTIESSLNFE